MPRQLVPQACHCGCGDWTNGGNFRPGHDARLRGDLLRAMRSWIGGRVRGVSMTSQEAEDELRQRGWHPTQHGTRTVRTPRQQTTRHFTFTPVSTPIDVAIESTEPVEWNERRFGVEMEFFGATPQQVIAEFTARGLVCIYEGYNHTTRPHWKIVTDSSVTRTGTGVDRGLEMVSPILAGEQGQRDLQTACEALQAAGAKVDRSCGVHVHHDTTGVTPMHVSRLVATYTAAQSVIDSFLPPSRRSGANYFCAPYTADVLASLERSAARASRVESLEYSGDGRYRTVNLEALGRHRTVEFRQHGGSIEYPKIGAWVRLGQRMIECSRVNSVAAPANLSDWLVTIGVSDEDRAFFLGRAEALARPRSSRRVPAGVR